MVITEVRIKLMEDNNERLLAFCSVTFDNVFVIRDLKIIEGTKGIFVAMPSRKLTDRCPRCGCKNHLRARFCNSVRLPARREPRHSATADGRAKLHADIAHPIHSGSREMVQNFVVKSYLEEKDRSKLPGYVCTYDEYDFDGDETPVSYGSVVNEMAGKAVRGHGPHAAPKGTHFHASDSPAAKVHASDDFGVGIG